MKYKNSSLIILINKHIQIHRISWFIILSITNSVQVNFNRIFVVIISFCINKTAISNDQLKYRIAKTAPGRKEIKIKIYPRSVAATSYEITVKQKGTRSWSWSYRLFFRAPCSSEISLRNPLRARGTPPPWALPCVSNEFTWRPTVYLRHFLPCVHACARVYRRLYTRAYRACACARGPASMWAEIPCSGRCWTIFPWPPSRYETWYDYTLSTHRRQGRIVLPDSSFDSTRSSPDTTQHFLSYNEIARLRPISIFDIWLCVSLRDTVYGLSLDLEFRKNRH